MAENEEEYVEFNEKALYARKGFAWLLVGE